ncbi:MAG: L-aspartate semialdehyde sulfurtransferase [Methanosarcinales archaeon]|nr:L-aspartate semialdehyde sulfurtransferase [Methanosarcinales archaeon]
MVMEKSLDLINARIREGSARVVTAEEMPAIVDELGEEGALAEVDVVTTGTFGAMCSTGAFFNFGHADPPIRMERVWLNDVEAYAGIAAVDAYLGATQEAETRDRPYGGAHVLEEFVSGATVELRATSHGTDCYPRRSITTELLLEDMNQAIMVNPRNAYQRYNVATNSTDSTIYTYMGTLLPNYGNATFSGSGVLSPLCNDPTFQTIGVGTRIFLCGAQGYIIGEGTQHDPENGFATLMVKGNLKEMSPEFMRAATFEKYGVSMYVGIGVPIPIINERVAASCAVRDSDIITNVLDYGVPRRKRPVLAQVSYEQLRSGTIEVMGREIKTSPLSSFKKSIEIAHLLKEQIERGEFLLTQPVAPLTLKGSAKPMSQIERKTLVREVMTRNIITVHPDDGVADAATKLIRGDFNHLPVVDEGGRLVGIITSWDVSKAVANGASNGKVADVMTRKVISSSEDEPVESAAHRLHAHNISALPVLDSERRVIGMITSEDISRLVAGR